VYLCVFHIKGVVQFRFKILKKKSADQAGPRLVSNHRNSRVPKIRKCGNDTGKFKGIFRDFYFAQTQAASRRK
jgi:hypothetical protein